MAGRSLTLDPSLPPAQGLYPESVSYVLGGPRAHLLTFGRTGERPSFPCPTPLFLSLSSAPGAARAPQWLFSRDLVGSGYAGAYTATNGSQVTEKLQR